MKLSQHFSREEFACRCGCGLDTVDAQLITVLERVRNHFDTPVRITSGARCLEHNADSGGSANSQHTKCKAADIDVVGVDPVEVASYLGMTYPSTLGVGMYRYHTHVDVRHERARW